MMVIFLTGLVAMILLRTLRNDYAKYTRDDDDIESLERDINEESGWKLVHGDVFRPPPNLALLAALLGTGVQLALLVLFVILITIAGKLLSPCFPALVSHLSTLHTLLACSKRIPKAGACDQQQIGNLFAVLLLYVPPDMPFEIWAYPWFLSVCCRAQCTCQ